MIAHLISHIRRPDPHEAMRASSDGHGSVSNVVLQLTIEHYPSGSVVARVFLTANRSVYTPVHELIAHCWREKEMVRRPIIR